MGRSVGSSRSLLSAPATSYAADQGLGTGGGMKKQGLPIGIGHYHDVIWFIKTKAQGTEAGRKMVFAQNMLGGIGRGRSQFGSPGLSKPDGLRRFAPYKGRSSFF